MTEGLARAMQPKDVEIASAGSAPGNVNPLAIETLAEMNIDTSGHWS